MSAETTTIRLDWSKAATMRDPELREWLRAQGLDTRAMTCKLDEEGRAYVYSGPRLTEVDQRDPTPCEVAE